MGWTYIIGDLLKDTPEGWLADIRLLIGDTDPDDHQLEDEEIQLALKLNEDNIYYSAAWSARAIGSKYARRVNTEVSGALKAQYSDLLDHYNDLATKLEYQGKTAGASLDVKAGGTTISDVYLVRSDSNRIQGSFRRDQFRNPPTYRTPGSYKPFDIS